MGKTTAIQWCHHTFNPWWGCEKISAACANCYAESIARRFGKDVWGKDAPRRPQSASYWLQPYDWDYEAQKAKTRRRVFCASMADVFEGRRDLDRLRNALWLLIDSTPFLDWLLLTKRPENILQMVPQNWLDSPRANVWIGTTVENQEQAEHRIPELLRVPARVRFLSCEPLLGPVDLGPWLSDPCDCLIPALEGAGQHTPTCKTFSEPWGLDWVIVGGESGPKARPMHPAWARQLRAKTQFYGVPFFFKQWGTYRPATNREALPAKGAVLLDHDAMVRVGVKAAGRELDGEEWNQIPVPAKRQVTGDLRAGR